MAPVGRSFVEVVTMYKVADLERAIVFQWEIAAEQPYVDAVRLIARQRPMSMDIVNVGKPLIVSKWEANGLAIALLPIMRRQ